MFRPRVGGQPVFYTNILAGFKVVVKNTDGNLSISGRVVLALHQCAMSTIN